MLDGRCWRWLFDCGLTVRSAPRALVASGVFVRRAGVPPKRARPSLPLPPGALRERPGVWTLQPVKLETSTSERRRALPCGEGAGWGVERNIFLSCDWDRSRGIRVKRKYWCDSAKCDDAFRDHVSTEPPGRTSAVSEPIDSKEEIYAHPLTLPPPRPSALKMGGGGGTDFSDKCNVCSRLL